MRDTKDQLMRIGDTDFLRIPDTAISDRDLAEWQNNLLLNDCILCNPEASRIIFATPHFFCMAGAGPVATGYSMITPHVHISTIAELDEELFEEFQFAHNFHLQVLELSYGAGYTAYEHGRLGSCRWAEMANSTGHHCFHAHRVFVAGSFNLTNTVRRPFQTIRELRTEVDLRQVCEPYIFLEEVSSNKEVLRHAFLHADGIPSQFLRRCIADSQGASSRWDWRRHPDWQSVRETVLRLRSMAKSIQLQHSTEAL